mmetsp:Transcript_76424/g.181789  ORF Transcript_76424/g.181789 Transcript_76424/m.181789 type:complete len:576 (+) Transcript_76424:98-1825(+)
MRRGFLAGGSTTCEISRLDKLRLQLADAEAELRQRRERRREVEAGNGRPVLSQEAQAAEAPQSATYASLDEEAIQALTSHEEPPPALHRLAQALVLVLECRLLASLGQHELPAQTSWVNLRRLLQKSWDPSQSAEDLRRALEERPFGVRVAGHIRERVLLAEAGASSESLVSLRQDVEAADARCLTLLDFVLRLVMPDGAAEAAELAADCLEELRSRAVQAVDFQEREVAKLRKQLREAEKSEAAALAFAEQNAPGKATKASQQASEEAPSSTTSEQELVAASSAKVPTESVAVIEEEGCDPSSTSIPELDFSNAAVVQKQQVQYRLGEVEVPPLQEAVLESMVNAVTDASLGPQRRLNVVGSCDLREDAEVAFQRADAVKAWLAENGVPSGKMVVSTMAAARGARFTELQLLDLRGKTDDMRKRAQDFFARSMMSGQPIPEASQQPPSQAQTTVEVEALPEQPPTSEAPPSFAGPSVAVEEFETSRSSGEPAQGVRIRFDGSSAQLDCAWVEDISLDVASECVRLSSLSDRWPVIEVALPFRVDVPSDDGAAGKFSKKTKTLTVTLLRSSVSGA